MRGFAPLVLAVGPLLGVGTAEAQSYPHAFPREGATQIFENHRVMIWEVLWLEGVAQPIYEHQYDMAGVFLSWGPLRVTFPDGRARESLEPFPVVPVPFYQGKGVTHKEEGIGQPTRHSISVDLTDLRPPPLAPRTDIPAAFPREGAEALTESDRVTIWDYTWQSGQSVPLHFHDKDAVAVFVNTEPAVLFLRGEDGSEERVTVSYKNVMFWPRDRAHSEEVVSGTPRAMIMELN